MERAAQAWIAADVARREQELAQLNDETIDAQQESLRLSTDRRVAWLKEQLHARRPRLLLLRPQRAESLGQALRPLRFPLADDPGAGYHVHGQALRYAIADSTQG